MLEDERGKCASPSEVGEDGLPGGCEMDEAEGGKDVPMEVGRSKDTCLCEAGAEEAADCDVISERSGSVKGSIEVGGRDGPGTRGI